MVVRPPLGTVFYTHINRCNSWDLGMHGLQEIVSWNQGADSARNCCRPQESKHGMNMISMPLMMTQKSLIF